MSINNPWTRRHTGVHPPLLRESLVETIGNTPLVRLNALTSHLPEGVEVWVKLEFMNPGGSIKDRAARQIILEAMASGALTREMTLIDATSGNTGVAYAMLGAALGIPITLVMPEGVPPQRKQLIEVYGARVIPSPSALGIDGAFAHLQEILKEAPEGTYFHANQHGNPANPMAHVMTTAAEVYTQTHERITHFVASMGSSSTVMGTGRGLKQRDPSIQIVGVQPDQAQHGIEGMRHMASSVVPKLYCPDELDDLLYVDPDESREMARKLAIKEGILSGNSGGANVLAALKLAQTLTKGVIVTIICDNHDRYSDSLT